VRKSHFPLRKRAAHFIIPYFPQAAGLLTGKYDKDTVFNDFRATMPIF